MRGESCYAIEVHGTRVVLLNIIALLFLYTALQIPLPEDSYVPLQYRLLPNFHGEEFRGRDVHSLISRQVFLFWRNTGETPASFLQLAANLQPALFRLTLAGQPRQRQRRQKLNISNQILLVMIWMRKYPHVDTVALLFDIDPTSVISIIYRTLPELWRYFRNQISWPSLAEWRGMIGNWPELPFVVGVIDATPHEIYRPLSEPQRLFYSGHRHYHCLNTQVIIDNEGNIRFLQAGFLGSTDDALSYRLMEQVGPGFNLDLPPNVRLLGDRGYPDDDCLLTPVRAGQMHLLGRRGRRQARKFNRALSKRRVKVEHVIKEVKTFKAVSQIWRLPCWLMPVCVELATMLAQRRLKLFRRV